MCVCVCVFELSVPFAFCEMLKKSKINDANVLLPHYHVLHDAAALTKRASVAHTPPLHCMPHWVRASALERRLLLALCTHTPLFEAQCLSAFCLAVCLSVCLSISLYEYVRLFFQLLARLSTFAPSMRTIVSVSSHRRPSRQPSSLVCSCVRSPVAKVGAH